MESSHPSERMSPALLAAAFSFLTPTSQRATTLMAVSKACFCFCVIPPPPTVVEASFTPRVMRHWEAVLNGVLPYYSRNHTHSTILPSLHVWLHEAATTRCSADERCGYKRATELSDDPVAMFEEAQLAAAVGKKGPGSYFVTGTGGNHDPQPVSLDARLCRVKSLRVTSRTNLHTIRLFSGPTQLNQTSALFCVDHWGDGCRLEDVCFENCSFEYTSRSLLALVQCYSLRAVSLVSCIGLSGWQDLASLPGLELLDVSHCALDFDIAVFSTCVSLKYLYCSGNRAYGFHALPWLIELDAGRCGLSDVSSIAGCSQLQRLSLAGNPIVETISDDRIAEGSRVALTALSSCLTELRNLDISNCGVFPLKSFIQLVSPKLSTLKLGGLPFLDPYMHDFECLGELPALRHLIIDMGYPACARHLPLHFVRCCSKLRSLMVFNADLAAYGCDSAPLFGPASSITMPRMLTRLILRSCQLRCIAGIEILAGTLAELDLEGNFLSGADVDPSLGSLVTLLDNGLEVLSLRAACVEDLDWMVMGLDRQNDSFRSLRVLDLSENTNILHCDEYALFRRICRVQRLFLPTSFPFSPWVIAESCRSLEELHFVQPSAATTENTMGSAATRVAFASCLKILTVYENKLTHGASLTFRFLRQLHQLAPSPCGVVLSVDRMTDEHIRPLCHMANLRKLALIPRTSWWVTPHCVFPAAVSDLVMVHSKQLDVQEAILSWITKATTTIVCRCAIRILETCEEWNRCFPL